MLEFEFSLDFGFLNFGFFSPSPTLRRMTKVRLGIIGMGNIGQHHHSYLSAGKVSRAELTAVSDAIPGKLDKYKPLKIFSDGEELIRGNGCYVCFASSGIIIVLWY